MASQWNHKDNYRVRKIKLTYGQIMAFEFLEHSVAVQHFSVIVRKLQRIMGHTELWTLTRFPHDVA